MYDAIEPYLMATITLAVGMLFLFLGVKLTTKVIDILTGDDNA